MNINPVYWGGGGWAIIFVAIYHYYKDIDSLIYFLDHFVLPCQTCMEHLRKKKKEAGFSSFTSPSKIRNFYVDVYNEQHKSNQIDISKLSNLDI